MRNSDPASFIIHQQGFIIRILGRAWVAPGVETDTGWKEVADTFNQIVFWTVCSSLIFEASGLLCAAMNYGIARKFKPQ